MPAICVEILAALDAFGEFPPLGADVLRGAAVGPNAKGILVLEGQQVGHLIEGPRDLFIVHGHVALLFFFDVRPVQLHIAICTCRSSTPEPTHCSRWLRSPNIRLMKDPKCNLTTRRDELTDRLARLDRRCPARDRAIARGLCRAGGAAGKRRGSRSSARRPYPPICAPSPQALTRLEMGTYGVCIECGKRIESARLQVMPASPRCMSCEA